MSSSLAAAASQPRRCHRRSQPRCATQEDDQDGCESPHHPTWKPACSSSSRYAGPLPSQRSSAPAPSKSGFRVSRRPSTPATSAISSIRRGRKRLLAGAEAARAVAVDDEVDVAYPVERLLGLDAGAGGEGEADEVLEGVLGRFAVHAGHARVPGRERPEHRHRLGAAALADEDPVGVHAQGVGDEVLEGDGGKAVRARRAAPRSRRSWGGGAAAAARPRTRRRRPARCRGWRGRARSGASSCRRRRGRRRRCSCRRGRRRRGSRRPAR